MQPLYDALRNDPPGEIGPLSGNGTIYRLANGLLCGEGPLDNCICDFWMKRRTLPMPQMTMFLTQNGKKCKIFNQWRTQEPNDCPDV